MPTEPSNLQSKALSRGYRPEMRRGACARTVRRIGWLAVLMCGLGLLAGCSSFNFGWLCCWCHRPVYAVDPCCYGYRPTQWRLWPDCCCPPGDQFPDGMAPMSPAIAPSGAEVVPGPAAPSPQPEAKKTAPPKPAPPSSAPLPPEQKKR